MKKTIVFYCLIIITISLNALTITIDEIRNSDEYLTGYGKASTYEKADQKALKDLISKISVQVEAQFTNIYEEEDETLKEYTQLIVNTYSNTTLRNALSKVDEESEPGKIIVLRYIEQENLDKLFKARRKKIIDYTKTAIKAESEARIGDALRYYYWALLLLRSHPENNEIQFCFDEGDIRLLITALPDCINRIFSFLSFEIASDKFDPEINKRLIKLYVNYNNKSVQSLDFSYYTGDNWSKNVTVKDGIGVTEYYDESAINLSEIDLKTEYRYYNKRSIDGEIRDVIEDTNNPSFSVSRYKIYLDEESEPEVEMQEVHVELESFSGSVDEMKYSDIMENIIDGIKSKNYTKMREFFTANGFDNFQKIVGYGNAQLIDDELSLFTAEINNSTFVRSIPMLFSFPENDRQFVDKLCFVFNEEDKVDAINFTLGEKAEKDILDQNREWGSLENKYQLIQFMEFYKTAYCLKDLEFVKDVFAENALIIVGHILEDYKKIENIDNSLGDRIEYIRLDKEEYINRLKTVFKSNEYVNVHFEDNLVIRANGKDKVYGIQIAQHYYSTNYSDKGYLFLMIDLTNENKPIIWVRTWQPEKNPDGSVIGLKDFQIY